MEKYALIRITKAKIRRIKSMYVQQFLHRLLGPVIHLGRLNSLILAVKTVIKTKQLQLTALGRGMEHPIQERSRIRKMDRLLGNNHLQRETTSIYKYVLTLLIARKKRPIIIVDWTKLPNSDSYALRAALATPGRALTVYEVVYSKKEVGNGVGNRAVHDLFLKEFSDMLPEACKPIIVTDAGFKNPWFRQVLAMGWDFVGRIRGDVTYSDDGKTFFPCELLHTHATNKIRYIGKKILAKKNPMKLAFYLVKGTLKGRKKYAKNGTVRQDKDSVNYSRSHREPWLLASSLEGFNMANKVNKIYKLRMTIEEGFRDLKSTRYGFSLSETKTINSDRHIILLLIAMLGSLIAYLTGKVIENAKQHYQYQANSIKHRRVLSFFFLGCQVWRDPNRGRLKLTEKKLLNICQHLNIELASL